MPDDDPYWDKECRGCSSIDDRHTNRECIEQVARDVRMPVEEAMKLFRPIDNGPPSSVFTNWQSMDKETRANG